jgi:hypothetical protein
VSSRWFSSLREKLGEVVVDAGHAEVRIPPELAAHILYPIGISIQELDDGENEVVRLIQRVENFVLGDRNRCGPCDAILDLKKS